MKKENVPYVYYIKNLTTQLKYIGVRYSKDCNPKDFWVTYFTSSKLIHRIKDVYGENDFEFRILKKFDDEFDALVYERHLLKLAIKKTDYINLHANFVTETKDEYYDNKEKMFKIHSFYSKLQSVLKIGFHGCSTEEKNKNCSMGGHAAAKINKELNRAIFDPEVRKRQHKTLSENQVSAFYDPSTRYDISSKGGKVGAFSKDYYEKKGLSESDRIKAQSERGKKGGAKNKGFAWYNDGVISYKYTPKQQHKLSFIDFLNQNLKFKQGRTKTKIKL